jgi:hypothetical protein
LADSIGCQLQSISVEAASGLAFGGRLEELPSEGNFNDTHCQKWSLKLKCPSKVSTQKCYNYPLASAPKYQNTLGEFDCQGWGLGLVLLYVGWGYPSMAQHHALLRARVGVGQPPSPWIRWTHKLAKSDNSDCLQNEFHHGK